MLGPATSAAGSPALPGLDHLRNRVEDWESAVRSLTFTAAAIADSVGVPVTSTQGNASAKPDASCGAACAFSQQAVPLTPNSPPAPAAATLPAPAAVLTASQLKPGRVFIVANLQGAYHTLIELLSCHKFDFRQDNLLHLGNLVAPPLPAPALAAAADAVADTAERGPAVAAAPRRCRNSAPLLKLVRRHCAGGSGGGAGGPMGANECLALLAAARANRLRAQQQREAELAKIREWQQQQQQHGAGGRGTAGTTDRGMISGRCSALSLQLAAKSASTGEAVSLSQAGATTRPTSRSNARWASMEDLGSDDSSSDGSSSGSEDEEVELVVAPMTPCHEEEQSTGPDARPIYATTSAAGCMAVGGGGGANNAPTRGSVCGLDDVDLAQLLAMPACVVLEPYGVLLQHAGPSPSAGGGRYHVLYSHRRAAAAASGAAPPSPPAGVAVATGLASCRDVVRCAVLPPLRTLQRRSHGFVARIASGAAPTQEELLLEVVEEPLAEVDLEAGTSRS